MTRASAPFQFRLSAIWLITLFLLAFFLWAAVFEIDQTVRLSGQVIPSERTQLIQAADGGVLSKIAVQEGDVVKRGQVLAELEPSRAVAGVEESSARAAALKAVLIRATAEARGATPAFGADLAAYPEFVNAQRALFQERRRAMASDLSVQQSALSMAQQELRMHESLMRTGDVSQLDLLRARRQVLEIQARIVAIRNKYLQDARAEAAKAQEDLSATGFKRDAQQDVLHHTRITSPVNGVIKVIRVTTVGGVLRPGDELMQIAPSEGGLVIEGKVSPADISDLRTGLAVDVRLGAYDPSIYGHLVGHLTLISPDTITEQGPNGQAMAFYRVQVRLDADQSANPHGQDMQVRPGMTATLDVRTGQRTVLTYLLKPIFRAFSGALTEH